jgi:hypothetical protein
MVNKRKSDTLDTYPIAHALAVLADSKKTPVNSTHVAKKSRATSEDASSSKQKQTVVDSKPKTWQDIVLEGEDEVSLIALTSLRIAHSLRRPGRGSHLVRFCALPLLSRDAS